MDSFERNLKWAIEKNTLQFSPFSCYINVYPYYVNGDYCAYYSLFGLIWVCLTIAYITSRSFRHQFFIFVRESRNLWFLILTSLPIILCAGIYHYTLNFRCTDSDILCDPFTKEGRIPADWYVLPTSAIFLCIISGVPFHYYLVPTMIEAISISFAMGVRKRNTPWFLFLLIMTNFTFISFGYYIESNQKSAWMKRRQKLILQDSKLRNAIQVMANEQAEIRGKEKWLGDDKDVETRNMHFISHSLLDYADSKVMVALYSGIMNFDTENIKENVNSHAPPVRLQTYDMTNQVSIINSTKYVKEDELATEIHVKFVSSGTSDKNEEYVGYIIKNVSNIVQNGYVHLLLKRLYQAMEKKIPNLLPIKGYMLLSSSLLTLSSLPSGVPLVNVLEKQNSPLPHTFVREVVIIILQILILLHEEGVSHGNISMNTIFVKTNKSDGSIQCELAPISVSKNLETKDDRLRRSLQEQQGKKFEYKDFSIQNLEKSRIDDLKNLSEVCFCCLLGTMDISVLSIGGLKEGSELARIPEQFTLLLLSLMTSSSKTSAKYILSSISSLQR